MPDAKNYAVYCSADNIKYVKIAVVNTTTFDDLHAMVGTSYYKVSADVLDATSPKSESVVVTGVTEEIFPIGDVFAAYLKTILPATAFKTGSNALIANSPDVRMFTDGIEIKNKGLIDLNGIQFFSGIESLYCVGNKLTTLDLSKNINLTFFYCNENLLTSLDISSQLYLNDLGIRPGQGINGNPDSSFNPLTELKVNLRSIKGEPLKDCKTRRGKAIKISTWEFSSADAKAICTDYDPNTDTCVAQ